MFIHELQITNFKNHENKSFLFDKKMVAFIGLNGVGKTNILDAIYFLCIGKSYFSASDKICVKEREDFFRIQLKLESDEMNDILAIVEKRKRKKIVLNDAPIEKLIHFVGKFPVVLVEPNDNTLILGGSLERRKFLDYTLSMVDSSYLSQLMQYNNVLKQRNALLKNEQKKGVDKALLSIYNENLSNYAHYIFEKRAAFIDEIQAYFVESFTQLAAKDEAYGLSYKSHLLDNDLSTLLKQSLERDLILQRTNKGTHRDDIVFTIAGNPLKEFGSQGQQKTVILALKLAQFAYLRDKIKKVPIFIIDDIFDKLDLERSKNLIAHLLKQQGQVFISNTDKVRLSHFEEQNELQIIDIE